MTGSADLGEVLLLRLYCIYCTEFYWYHRSDHRGYYEKWPYTHVLHGDDWSIHRREYIDRVLKVCVEYRQASLNAHLWVPEWAIRAQCIASLETLKAM